MAIKAGQIITEDVIDHGCTSIYALRDPNTMELRYIGKAVDPVRRLRQHLEPAQLNRYRSRKNSWLKSLTASGKLPYLEVVDVVEADQADVAERYWINWYRSQGADLTNGTDGGDGGAVTDPDARARIAAAHQGVKRSDETRKKMSASAQKRCADEEERERLRSISNKKPPIKPGEKNNSRLTEVQVREMRRLHSEGVTGVELARRFGVTPANVSLIIRRRAWAHVSELPDHGGF